MTSGTAEHESRVVATYGRRVELLLPCGRRVSARPKGRRLRPVCGDYVIASPLDADADWLLTEILPRKNELTRPDSRGRPEVLAANATLLAVVTAPLPSADWFIVDRYLSAAELMNAGAIIVFNKTDIAEPDGHDDALEVYRRIGYPTVVTSVKTGDGIERLRALLHGETAIFVGQSGVGKSSLINALTGDSNLRTGAVSERSGEGRHTTVNSAMLFLDEATAVIDSPGVRDYAPAIGSPRRVPVGFREIAAASGDCRYANCRHLREPDCAVKAAADAGRISRRRLESYRRLLRLTEEFAGRR